MEEQDLVIVIINGYRKRFTKKAFFNMMSASETQLLTRALDNEEAHNQDLADYNLMLADFAHEMMESSYDGDVNDLNIERDLV